jgi:acyl-CoA thioester hydrolase
MEAALYEHLSNNKVLPQADSPVQNVMTDASCSWHKQESSPAATVNVGMAVSKLGRTSVTYQVGMFKEQESKAIATGSFVFVYFSHKDHNPTHIPEHIRTVLHPLCTENADIFDAAALRKQSPYPTLGAGRLGIKR